MCAAEPQHAPQRLGLRRHAAVLLTLAALAAWWLAWGGRSPLLFDEAYYWDWSRHLAAGYLDHPPLVAWLIRLGTLPGTSELTVRLGMVGCGVGTAALAFASGTLLGGRLAGWLSLLFLASCPLLAITAGFAAPDAPLLLCWAGAVYAALRAVAGGQIRSWYAAGALLGLAVLAKYSALLLVPSLGLYLLLSRQGWRARPQPYLALLPALLAAAPNILWNARHSWASFHFQTTHGACVAAARGADYPQQALLYAQNQLTLAGPLLFVPLLIATGWALWRGVRCGEEGLLLLACCAVVIHGIFFVLHGVRHWAAPGYFSALICAGVLAARLLDGPAGARRRWVVAGCSLAIVAGVLETVLLQGAYLAHANDPAAPLGLVGRLARPIEPGLVDTEPDWRRLARTVDLLVRRLPPEERAAALVLADRYGTAAELAFYRQGRPVTYSGSNQYGSWPPGSTPRLLLFVGPQEVLDSLPAAARAGGTVLARLPLYDADGRQAGQYLVTRLGRFDRATLESVLEATRFHRWSCR